MALIPCSECNKEISDQAKACPHCGSPAKKSSASFACGSIVALLILLPVGVMISFASCNSTTSNEYVGGSYSPSIPHDPIRLKGVLIGNAPHRVALVAVDEVSLVEMMEMLDARNSQGVMGLIVQNRGTLLREGTQVRVLLRKTVSGMSAMIYQINVLEGDLAGRTVWTHSYFIP
jgi:hypothetical protein